MAADFTATRITETEVSMTGATVQSYRMLGVLGNETAGIPAVGNGSWINVQKAERKTAQIYPLDQAAGAIGAAEIEIQAAMELDAANPDANTKYFVMETLDASSPWFTTDIPVRWMRAVVKVVGADKSQVGLHFTTV